MEVIRLSGVSLTRIDFQSQKIEANGAGFGEHLTQGGHGVRKQTPQIVTRLKRSTLRSCGLTQDLVGNGQSGTGQRIELAKIENDFRILDRQIDVFIEAVGPNELAQLGARKPPVVAEDQQAASTPGTFDRVEDTPMAQRRVLKAVHSLPIETFRKVHALIQIGRREPGELFLPSFDEVLEHVGGVERVLGVKRQQVFRVGTDIVAIRQLGASLRKKFVQTLLRFFHLQYSESS